MNLESKIEGLLFYKGEPVEIKEIAKLLDVKIEEVKDALETLKSNLAGRGMMLMEKNDEVMLATSSELAPILEKIRKDELTKELSKASLETLAVIIYKKGATRSEIDYIRGVNSNFILRNLSIRGLVEKITDPGDQRRYIYRPTFELLSFLGVPSVENMPDFEKVMNTLVNEMQNNISKEEGEEQVNA